MGSHFCYGDLGQVHFWEPSDTGVMVGVANELTLLVERSIDCIPMMVPKVRVAEEVPRPLGELKVSEETEIVLGLVHMGDLEGTRRRMEIAGRFLDRSGVAAEGGLGRHTSEDFESVVKIMAVAAQAVSN